MNQTNQAQKMNWSTATDEQIAAWSNHCRWCFHLHLGRGKEPSHCSLNLEPLTCGRFLHFLQSERKELNNES